MSDLIRRSDAIEALHGEVQITGKENAMAVQHLIGRFTFNIANIPSADVIEPKRGEWKVRGNPERNLWECSLCRCTIYSESESDRNEFHKWCGRCGARMKGADDD